MSDYPTAEEELKDMTRRFWAQVDIAEKALERVAELEAECDVLNEEANAVNFEHSRIAALEQKVNMLELLEVKYIEEIQELHDRIIALRAI